MSEVRVDDLEGPGVRALLQEHFEDMLANSPPGSCHFLDIEALKKSDVVFWTMWDDAQLMGCCALKELSADHGEIKSMRTHSSYLRRGVGARLLEHLISVAEGRGYARLSLETGSSETFTPALKLYERFGFLRCAPFAEYRADPFSVFMTRPCGGDGIGQTSDATCRTEARR